MKLMNDQRGAHPNDGLETRLLATCKKPIVPTVWIEEINSAPISNRSLDYHRGATRGLDDVGMIC